LPHFVYFAGWRFLKSKIQTKNSKLVAALLDWFVAHARDLPWRRTRDPYAVWVSEIMLQQTQVKAVIPFWERWMRELPTIEAAAKADSAKLHKLWEGLGYYTRVRNLQRAAQVILEKHGGTFPEEFEEVLALPGIGRYTAGAICSIAFNQPTPILDGNVIRVLTRIFGITENPKEKTTNARLWRIAAELVSRARTPSKGINSSLRAIAMQSPDIIASGKDFHGAQTALSARPDPHASNPRTRLSALLSLRQRRAMPLREEESCSHLNQSLMELGALVCTPRNPQCRICPAQKMCAAFRGQRIEELPNLGERQKVTARRFIAFAIECDGKFLVRQRPDGVVNAHLWEFPNVEVNGSNATAKEIVQSEFGLAVPDILPLVTVKHSITRFRITLEAFRGRMKDGRDRTSGVWRTPEQLRKLAFASAHGKILRALCL
jgi:A/G-specific adenine glycosylase